MRSRLFGAFEMAELTDDATARAEWMTFVVVGGGPTGVEMAGQIAASIIFPAWRRWRCSRGLRGRTIARQLAGRGQPKPFKYRDLGTMAIVSRFKAVGSIGPILIWGFVGWLGWLVVHLVFLTGFKNRVLTLVNWTIAFVIRGRPERTITARQALGMRQHSPAEHDEETGPTAVSS